jgi:hypothetical protein
VPTRTPRRSARLLTALNSCKTRDGKNVYSADITLNGEEWDLTVAEDGSVISKEKEGPAKK